MFGETLPEELKNQLEKLEENLKPEKTTEEDEE